MYDKNGRVVHESKRVIRGLSEEEFEGLKAKVEDLRKKMAALCAAENRAQENNFENSPGSDLEFNGESTALSE